MVNIVRRKAAVVRNLFIENALQILRSDQDDILRVSRLIFDYSLNASSFAITFCVRASQYFRWKE